MAYTEFRKSYGDFEIVIPAIDFSKLNSDEAQKTIEILRRYERNSKILRKEWCNHMANEIEREHFGHANQTT